MTTASPRPPTPLSRRMLLASMPGALAAPTIATIGPTGDNAAFAHALAAYRSTEAHMIAVGNQPDTTDERCNAAGDDHLAAGVGLAQAPAASTDHARILLEIALERMTFYGSLPAAIDECLPEHLDIAVPWGRGDRLDVALIIAALRALNSSLVAPGMTGAVIPRAV